MEANQSGQEEKATSPAGWVRHGERVRAAVERSPGYQRAAAFYKRRKRWAPLLFFFGGVLWDVLTLDRIDAWLDNLILLVYLIVLGGLLLVITLVEYKRVTTPRLLAYRHWYPHAMQFFLGALFSAYVIFYFQSATLAPSSVFLILLLVLLVANEFIHRRLFNLYLLFSLYFLASFSFFLFFIPVVTKSMSYAMFWLAGLLSLGLVGTMLVYLKKRALFANRRQFVYALSLVVVLFGVLNVFFRYTSIWPIVTGIRTRCSFFWARSSAPTSSFIFRAPRWRRRRCF